MATNNAINEPTAASGKVLQGQGVGTTSAFSTATYPSTATGTGTILRADGTNWVASTSTYPNTNAINTLLYASSANVMSALSTANSGVLTTDGSGVPSIATAGTSTTPTCVGASTAGTTTYTTQVGRYFRLGPLVIYTFSVSGTWGGTAAGNVNISIPVTASSTTGLNNWGTGYAQPQSGVLAMGAFQIAPSANVMTFFNTSGAAINVTASNTFNFQGTVTYFAA